MFLTHVQESQDTHVSGLTELTDICIFFTTNIFKMYTHFLSFFNILFYIGVWPINIAVIFSGGQQRDSAIHIHVSISPQTPSEGVFKST